MFRFKQFNIEQDRTAMKVGTDGVLLGAWASVRPSDRRMLDIGTGTGLIALMLAQRAPDAQITGVDVEEVSQACENAAASPWSERLGFVQCPVQEYQTSEPFDLIVSNPPFFTESLTCPAAGRTAARHTVHLSFEELHLAAMRLLAPAGRLAVVLPTAEGERFLRICTRDLFLVRRTEVRTTPRRAPKRVLMEFSREVCTLPVVETLTIGTGEHEQYTSEYKALTGDFYLKF